MRSLIEALESRQMLSGVVLSAIDVPLVYSPILHGFTGGYTQIIIKGDNANHSIALNFKPIGRAMSTWEMDIKADGKELAFTSSSSFDPTDNNAIRIDTGNGNDTVGVSVNGVSQFGANFYEGLVVNCGKGNNIVRVQTSEYMPVTINCGKGKNDVRVTRQGDAPITLNGGSGYNYLRADGAAGVTINAGSGRTFIDERNISHTGQWNLNGGSGYCLIDGGIGINSYDTLGEYVPGGDIIMTGSGISTIYGGSGTEFIYVEGKGGVINCGSNDTIIVTADGTGKIPKGYKVFGDV